MKNPKERRLAPVMREHQMHIGPRDGFIPNYDAKSQTGMESALYKVHPSEYANRLGSSEYMEISFYERSPIGRRNG